MHSDVLCGRYGPISAHVLRHDSKVRAAHLVDVKGVSRTFAITLFEDRMPVGLREINSQISGGTLIGEAFRNAGYEIRKNVVQVSIVDLPAWLCRDFHLKAGKRQAKARLSEFYARKRGTTPAVYGTVVEIYHPDFRPPKITVVDVAQVNAPTQALGRVGFSKEEIWNRIGAENNWVDVKERLAKARRLAVPILKKLNSRLSKVLACPVCRA